MSRTSTNEGVILVSVKVDYSKIDACPSESDRLFKVMMRLEFALKEIGCGRRGRGQVAEVDWDKFANERLGKKFFDEIKASGKAITLMEQPPKRQVINEQKSLSWEKVGAASNIQDFVGALRRVRNNLFHGGKSGDPDRDRNDALVKDALFAVDAILQYDSELQMMFEGKY